MKNAVEKRFLINTLQQALENPAFTQAQPSCSYFSSKENQNLLTKRYRNENGNIPTSSLILDEMRQKNAHESESVSREDNTLNLNEDEVESENDDQMDENDNVSTDSGSSTYSNAVADEPDYFDLNINDDDEAKTFLRNWYFKHNISVNSMTELLTWLSSNPSVTSSLPKDAWTLLKTPRNVNLTTVEHGEFYYFLIRN